jgi:hypothetical protein
LYLWHISVMVMMFAIITEVKKSTPLTWNKDCIYVINL